MIYVIPVVTAVLGLALGWAFLRSGLGTAAWAVGLLLAAVMVWAFYKSQTAQGWDALGYAVVWLLGIAPALVGMAIGGTIGHARRIKAHVGRKPG